MKTFRKIVGALVLVAVVSVFVIPAVYIHFAGPVVRGQVITKREFFEMPGGDRWSHVFEVTYGYKPPDTRYPETASHPVDEALYRRLQAGSDVDVRYSAWPAFRHWRGVGSALEESSYFSRLPGQSGNLR